METVACDFCGGSEAEIVATQTDKLHRVTEELFTVARCLGCGLHFTNPRPSPDEIGRYYSTEYSFHSVPGRLKLLARAMVTKFANGPLSWAAEIAPPISRRLAAFVKPEVPDPVRAYYANGGSGAFLDIGCGSGISAHFWGEAGALRSYRRFAEVFGVETAAYAREGLAAVGVEAWPDLDSVPRGRRFGVIRMNWSLEHVHSPARYFAFFRDHLQAGGRVVIAVPNYDGIIYRIAPECVELPIHLFHFRPLDLKNYAGRNGLQVVNLQTFSYPQMFTVAGQAGMLPQPFAREMSLHRARALQLSLEQFDLANLGNDMIAILAPGA